MFKTVTVFKARTCDKNYSKLALLEKKFVYVMTEAYWNLLSY